MAFYTKIGMLILRHEDTQFLVCEKDPKHVTSDYIMPGGKFEEADEVTCLRNEIMEELGCEVDVPSLAYVGEYVDVAAGRPDRDVSITLYRGRIIGEPAPHTEIKALHWIGAADAANSRISPIIRNRIIPDLVGRGILKRCAGRICA